MGQLDTLPARLLRSRRVVLAAFLVATLVLGAGALTVELEPSHEALVGETERAPADEYVEEQFEAGPRDTETAVLLVTREHHVVGVRDVLEQIEFQRRLQEDDRVAPTLAEDHPPLGVANVVGHVAVQLEVEGRSRDEVDPLPRPRPPLDEQRAVVRESDWETDLRTYEMLAVGALNDRPGGPAGGVYAFVPQYYDNRYEQRAQGTAIYVYQRADLDHGERLESQTAMREIAAETFSETPAAEERVYGAGIVDDELARSTTDSLRLVGPIALLAILAALLFAYRDPVDVALALFGVCLVLVWTFGFVGWAGIPFNQLFVAVPVLLVGLAIDFSLHSVMRYREARTGDVPTTETEPANSTSGEGSSGSDPGVVAASTEAVGSVGAAFALVTLTTATAFAAGITSPLPALRRLGVVAAVGMVSAFVVFAVVVPALKAELDLALEARGHDRRRRPFATAGTRVNAVLEGPVRLAVRTPWLVVAAALLLATLGLVGAATLETTFDERELHVDETPAWADAAPGPLAPGEYQSRGALEFLRESGFVSDRNTAHVLVRGNVTHPESLQRLDRAGEYAHASDATLEFGREDLREVDVAAEPIRIGHHPLGVMEAVAAENESFAATLAAADTSGDGVPDSDLESVFDALFAADEAAAETVVHRETGADGDTEYVALRMAVYTDGTEPAHRVAGELDETASIVDESDHLSATATGQPVVRADVQRDVFSTVVRGLVVTLLVVGGILLAVYRRTGDGASLGAVVLLPVLSALAWLLGTMALLGVRFDLLTALVTSFTVGLGVDYAIHVGERYVQELRRQPTVESALRTTVHGTGGALLGSATTTVTGFGVLVFALLDPLRSFGVVVSLTIVYAFVASVVVLPSLLVLWTRWRYGAGGHGTGGSSAPAE